MSSARFKLNESHFLASFVVAAFLGTIFQSWLIFVITSALMIGGSLHSGKIRLNPPSAGRRRILSKRHR